MLRPADNPFASHRIERLTFRPQGTTWDDLLTRLQSLHYRACILGQQGSGKTTLLEQLAHRLQTTNPHWRIHLLLHHAARPPIPWLHLPRWNRQDLLLLDGADLLPPLQWRLLSTLTHHLAGLIVVSHDRLLLPELITCHTTPDLLANLLTDLSPTTPLDAPSLWQKHQGNLREALREAYDQAARSL